MATAQNRKKIPQAWSTREYQGSAEPGNSRKAHRRWVRGVIPKGPSRGDAILGKDGPEAMTGSSSSSPHGSEPASSSTPVARSSVIASRLEFDEPGSPSEPEPGPSRTLLGAETATSSCNPAGRSN